ncbi:MetQ/NlpA family ABC transporter substrate-binding protein [Irregularibacter muris]|uniref:Lipoprotein n=1 Tax=Irregularibacter muris TaxID=1796619 RepID=A0AAE3HGP8_9FIRM|nr:MetQ/NlpA family ABC transporter substrate-binding protein [Irregularibacter muris]MCR1899846.1 MetQ/NlpA family ABC transporter substrate-binding protein [Irregularibacter muris]
MKKLLILAIVAILIIAPLAGCSATTGNREKINIKLGVNGAEHQVWDYVQKKLAEENIELEIISFSDYVRPNLALAEGEIDANAFQTIAYFDQFKADHNLDLVSIGNTILAPMAIYSEKLKSLDEVKEGDKVALPNDATNGGRGLILLQSAGLITLKEGVGLIPTIKDVVENPKNLELIELAATQIPRSLADVDIAIINNGVAIEADFSPTEDSIFIEDASSEDAKPYINIIAVKSKDKDKEALKRLVEIYQEEATKEVIDEVYKGNVVPAF